MKQHSPSELELALCKLHQLPVQRYSHPAPGGGGGGGGVERCCSLEVGKGNLQYSAGSRLVQSARLYDAEQRAEELGKHFSLGTAKRRKSLSSRARGHESLMAG